MIQKVRSYITIYVPDVDLTLMTDLAVTIEQRSTETELTYSGDNVYVTGPHGLSVEVPKDDAMKLDNRGAKGQVMFTDQYGVPRITKIFAVPVYELLKEDGYGN